MINSKRDTSGRIVSIALKISDFCINLGNIYAPTNLTERKLFFESFHEYFLPADAIVIAGDFNCYEYHLDKFGGNVSCAKYLSDFCSAFKLVDAWHRLYPQRRQCSWFNSALSVGSCLDKIFVSESFMTSVINCEIKLLCLSDHDTVFLSFHFNDLCSRGSGLWKFNNSLLQDVAFSDYVSERMNDLIVCLEHFPPVKLWWDFFKNSIKAEIISFAKTKRKNLSHERVVLTIEILRMKALLSAGDSSVVSSIRDIESKLKGLVFQELNGCTIRSKAQFLEEGEKPTRFFFKLEHERIQRNHISSILNSDGIEVFSYDEIEQEHVCIYSDLFSEEAVDACCKQSCLAGIEKHLSFSQQQACEGFLSLQELTESVKSLNLGKSLRSDGLSV